MNTTKEPVTFLSALDVAKELKVGRIRVYQLIYSGKLKAERFGGTEVWMIRRKDLDAFMLTRKMGPGRPKRKKDG